MNKISCSKPICGGWLYPGKGFNNPVVHAEFIHNFDYSQQAPSSAFFADQGQQWPGKKKQPIRGFDW